MSGQPHRVAHVPAKRRRATPRVNWGRGRLLPYESNVSFLAKFSQLNGLTPIEARRFLSKKCSYCWDSDGFQEIVNPKLARLLDEDIALVRLLSRRSLDLITCFGGRGQGKPSDALVGRDNNHYRFSYCSECMEMGFHASFHEYHWLSKCPIHPQVQLTLHREYPHRNFDSYCYYVKDFIDVISQLCPQWLAIEKTSQVHSCLHSRDFVAFKRWVKIAQKRAIAINASSLIAMDGEDYTANTFDQFMGRIQWLNPAQQGVSELFSIKTHPVKPRELRKLSEQNVNKLEEITSKINYRELRSFYCKQVILENEQPVFRQIAHQLLARLESLDHPCQCSWSRDGNGHWWKKCLDDIELSGCDLATGKRWGGPCPVETAAEILKLEWCDFTYGVSAKNRFERWQDYVRQARLFQSFGYLEWTAKDDPPYLKPLGTLNFSDDFRTFLESLLRVELHDYAQAIAQWLQQIEEGIAPSETHKSVPRVHVLHDGAINYLLRWPLN